MKQLLKKQYVSLDDDLYKDYIQTDINVNELLGQKGRRLVEDTLYLQVGLVAVIGILYVSPESVSKWSPEQKELGNFQEKWLDNIQEGPVIDKDDFFINYIGHPVSGAYYYTVARNDGYGWFESFLYSFFVSTFIWEYGYEALAEVPSTQDLISTPVVGAFMGEGLYYLEMQLDKNGGLIYGSRVLGNIAYGFLNPLGRMSESLSETFGISVTMRLQTYQNQMALKGEHNAMLANRPYIYNNYNYGVLVNFEF
jgi:hypothetical protein